MSRHDVLVIGGGISGIAFAFHAARAGRSVRIIEASPRLGGCLHTHTTGDGFWVELGAHTCYNSYGAFIELLEGLELMGELQPRGKPALRFLDGDRVLPGKNLGALLRAMSLWELARSLPRALAAAPAGRDVEAHYGRLVGARNYRRVLGPMLSAVPSQSADAFPADMLFKKRQRRKDVRRSYTLRGGLGSLARRVERLPGVAILTGRSALAIERSGAGFAVRLDGGERAEADVVALATPPGAAARLLAGDLPDAAARVAEVKEVTVDTVGVVVRADAVKVPYSTFLIPRADIFFSVVTRDIVPDPTWRGFAFHFRPGHDEAERLARIAAVLAVPRAAIADIAQRCTVLPSPVLGHHELTAAVDAALVGERVAVCGNWFAGLAIEDCAHRARSEWLRIARA